MAKKLSKNIKAVYDSALPRSFIPRMSLYSGIVSPGRKISLKRRAKFAPQLLADGLTSGIVSDQGNLVHSVFDDPGSTMVDPYSNIHSDKFQLMQEHINPAVVDPNSAPPTSDTNV